MKNPYLSIVIPTYNEEKNIKKTLDEVLRYLSKNNFSWEVIISDDGSRDKTTTLVKDFAENHREVRLLISAHQGKGPTLIKGMMAANGDIILFTDADLATPIKEADKLLSKFRQGYDVVIGSRGLKREGAPIHRLILAQGFNFLVQLLALPGISDTQCGFKGFKKDALRKILGKTRLFKNSRKLDSAAVTPIFDVELLYLARKLKFKIAQVPINWHHVGTKRVNPLRDAASSFLGILKLRLNDLKGEYD